MTRIIAGAAGSLRLAVPATGTRPTSERVREALFSALEAQRTFEDARVLDLYAGSGALGLEAASRGASEVTFVEQAAGVAAMCRRNVAAVLRALPMPKPTFRVVERPVAGYLIAAPAGWDIAFLDPPYAVGEDDIAAVLGLLSPRLAEDGMVIVERSRRSAEPTWPVGIVPQRRRDYGDTTLWWAERTDATPSPS